jgi:hypothetical protein
MQRVTHRCYKVSVLGLRIVGPLSSRHLVRSLIFDNIAANISSITAPRPSSPILHLKHNRYHRVIIILLFLNN